MGYKTKTTATVFWPLWIFDLCKFILFCFGPWIFYLWSTTHY